MKRLKSKRRQEEEQKKLVYLKNFQNPDSVHRTMFENKPDYMTEYEYKLMCARQRKENQETEALKKNIYWLHKQEYLQDLRDQK